ncbi:prolyl oligopeptidase family serine peptidase [Gallaecimonas xiamenensis]|uniref:Peptidase S9 prolyl oligopeptidase n=1 Tax=Gallaecimonas xiamenensis 3-C-1 TaxID=745411 RepID=K2J691_9GAMM|nr:prolyl oligopeptidase family serine peptidase [Gallaecimonas xiamenensis]EKE70568.1 peptidase S9 prolyl oligopeptidase [Gallaecimonas xiamenensis 3-C-1]
MILRSLLLTALLSGPALAQGRPVTLNDLMDFKAIDSPVLSDNGQVLAFSAQPDRGDATGVIRLTDGSRKLTVERGSKPALTPDGRYVAFWQQAPLFDRLKAKAKDKPKKALVVVDTQSGAQLRFDKASAFALSDKGGRLVVEVLKAGADQGDGKKAKDEKVLLLVDISSGSQQELGKVAAFAFKPGTGDLLYAKDPVKDQAETKGELRLLADKDRLLDSEEGKLYRDLTFSKDGSRFAALRGNQGDEEESRAFEVLLYNGKLKTLSTPDDGYYIGAGNILRFTEDNRRLFVGRKPLPKADTRVTPELNSPSDVTNIDKILASRKLRVWQGDDPQIKPQEAKTYKARKDHLYLAVFHLNNGRFVQLADQTVPDVAAGEQSGYLLGSTDQPYLKATTWNGFYRDYYGVNLSTGEKRLIGGHLGAAPSLSPQGHYAVFFEAGNVKMADLRQQKVLNLTQGLPVGFSDEDHDYPSEAPGYGFGPWYQDASGVLVYDKFDIWRFGTDGKGQKLTAKRADKLQLRVVTPDPDQPYVSKGQALLLTGYSDKDKYTGFFRLTLGQDGVAPLLLSPNSYQFLAKAKKADTWLFTRESFSEFPDIWVDDANFRAPRKLTDANPVTQELAWGQPELVHWRNLDGQMLDGVLIKPAGYDPAKRYPVLVYYYRFMSDRLYRFNEFKVNHRPNFAYYSSNGYAVFLPDVRFAVGTPGKSSVSALVPGVQKLIDMGVADPKAIGLHGHSWSGYQTAFVVTQTNIFAAAAAGAPVSNMTSAYSGMRWGAGIARQFQYETGQSRIGQSLYEAPELYIENSPVFYADRIKTPLLIEFGDKDEAVPWEQGIELYLALRRQNKPVVMLQYEGEPHHLKQYGNKLDYTIKMKAFFDHYLKGAPAPAWWSQGEPYQPPPKAKKKAEAKQQD